MPVCIQRLDYQFRDGFFAAATFGGGTCGVAGDAPGVVVALDEGGCCVEGLGDLVLVICLCEEYERRRKEGKYIHHHTPRKRNVPHATPHPTPQ